MPKLTLGLLLILAGPADAAETGGASAPGDPTVTALKCIPTRAVPCPAGGTVAPGSRLRVVGRELNGTRAVIFRGGRGSSDDVRVRARHVRERHVEARVPRGARSGPLAVVGGSGAPAVSARRVRIEAPPVERPLGEPFFLGATRLPAFAVPPGFGAVDVVRTSDGNAIRRLGAADRAGTVTWDGLDAAGAPAADGSYRFQPVGGTPSAPFALYAAVFPIRGRHDLGQTVTNDFGGGRNHRGQDMFAACGTPVAAARSGRVREAGTEGSMGNYAVITNSLTGEDHVYMHMRAVPLVTTGQLVATGDPIGEIGDTGNATGCHLHFERWTSPGWHSGGRAVDPLPQLRAWSAYS